jgi:endonuclease G
MIISPDVVSSASERAKRHLPPGFLEEIERHRRKLDFVPERDRNTSPQAISNRVAQLVRGGARPTEVEFERLMGTNDLVDEFYLERALLAAHPVCRLSIRAPSGHERGCATGFMVSPRLLLTNHHVFPAGDDARFSIAEFNYRFDVAGNADPSFTFRLRPDLFFLNHDALDYALVAVEPVGTDGVTPLSRFGYLRLIPDTGKALLKEWMTIVQHPGGKRRQFAIRENQCVQDSDPDVVWYMSDTAQGSSGSPVLNDSFQVVALHHAGQPRKDAAGNFVLKNGKSVSSLQDVDDSEVDWIANAGIRVSRICAHVLGAGAGNAYVDELKQAMNGTGDVLADAFAHAGERESGTTTVPSAAGPVVSGGRLLLGSLVLDLGAGFLAPHFAGTTLLSSPPILTAPPTPVPSPGPQIASTAGAVEALREPIIDTDYKGRKGFRTRFLGVDTPLPRVTDPSVVAPMLDGRKIIPYEHFSVVLHRERRMAVYTASNVDWRPAPRRPEAGRNYSRDALCGLGENDQEKWVLDPRVDAKLQVPDAFYTKDNGAFDKGHIVRRDDVCFGASYAEVQRANGDTFHVTNCSPQRGSFNRSNLGGIWGDLESFIGSQADKEQYCIFAGPVLAPDDEVFAGTERVQIPRRYWKVVCAVKNGALQVFAFILEQDLTGLPLEFQVDAEWKHRQVSLKSLESTVRLVKFPRPYHDADQISAPVAKPKRLRVPAPESIVGPAGSVAPEG